MLLTPPMWECSSGSIASTSMVVALRGISAVSSPSKHGLRRKRVRRRRPREEMVTLVGIPASGPYTGPSRKSAARSKLYQPLLASITKGRTSARRARVRIALFLDGGTGRIDGKGTREPPCGRDGKAEASRAYASNLDLPAMKPRGRHGRLGCLPLSTFSCSRRSVTPKQYIGDCHGRRCIVAA